MDCQEEFKTTSILQLSKIKMQIYLLSQEEQDKKIYYLKKALEELQEINSQNQPIEDIKPSSPNDEHLKQQVIFDLGPLNNLDELITKSKKIKKIISQNLGKITSQTLQNNLNLFNEIDDSQRKNFKQSIINLRKQTLKFLKMIQNELIFFDDKFLKKCKEQTNDQKIPKLLHIFTFDFLNLLDQGIVHQVGKVDIVQNIIAELKNDMKIDQEENIFDIFSDSSYKVRELVVFNLIKIQSIIQEQSIQEFCEDLLKQIWIIEKHPNVRNLLKNEEMIKMQKRLFSHDLQNFFLKINLEMQKKFEKIKHLQTQVLVSDNQLEIKKSLQQEYDAFEVYLDNITDMSQRLDISLIFLREISKDLKNIKLSIDSILTSVKGVENDIRRLRSRNFMELLIIRKEKVLNQKQENELDQIHIEIQTQEYDPISGNKKQNNSGEFVTSLMKFEDNNNYDGEVNEFLWSEDEKQKDVMLIKGKAGSGKSRASRNIEEFIWIYNSKSPYWTPIYVSLPSIKEPNQNLIEKALNSQNYNFDNTQIREFKDAVKNGKLSIVIILESYDEMKIDLIGTNLYNTNRLDYDLNLQAQVKVKFIITTREEILNSIGYQTWFYGSNLQNFKEVEILPFSEEQSAQYLEKYAKISVKRAIKKFYEFLKQLMGQNFQLNEFMEIWSQIENTINSIIQQRQKSDIMFLNSDIEKIIKAIENVKLFSFISSNQILSLKQELLQLWGENKYLSVINNLDIRNLLCTPFMMEIIVYVLPETYSLLSKASRIRELLKKNYMFLKMEAKTSEANMEIYSKLRKNNFQFVAKEDEINISKEIVQQFDQILKSLENEKFFEQLSMAGSLQYVNNTTILSNKYFTVDFDANFIVSAFKLHKYTAFEFYEIFVNFYHTQQLQKLKALGQSIKEETMIKDLQDFSIFLAIEMSMNQLTQVNYQQKGKLHIVQVQLERKVEVSWEDLCFSENQDDFEYKTQLRKCMLINSKGSVYAFNHKSIQEYFVAKYIVNLIEKIIPKENQTFDENFLKKSSFNKSLFNLSLEHYSGTIELLKPKIKQIEDIKNKLIKIALLSRKDSKHNLIRSASNLIYILGALREHFHNIDLSNLNIEDTKLDGISFYKCNLSNSLFNYVSIDSCNFNYATIEHATWKKLICKEKPSIKTHNKTLQQAVFSEDGKFLISGSQDGVIIKSELSADSEPKNAKLPNDELLKKLSIGKNWLACLSQQFLYIYNLIDLKESQRYPKKSEYFKDIEDIRLSPNDKYLALLLKNGKIIFLQVENLLKQQKQPKYQTTQETINCIAISSNSQLLATGGNQILIWKYTNIPKIQCISQLPKQEHPILAIAFSYDNQVLAVASDNKKLEFFNISNLSQVRLQYTFDQQQKIQQIAYSNKGELFASRSLSSIDLYEVQKLHDQQNLFKINSKLQVDLIEISSDSQILATSHQQILQSDNPKIIIWDIKSLQQIKQIKVFLSKHQKNISALKIRKDNKVLASGSLDHSICLWNLKTLLLFVKLTDHQDQVLDLAFSSDGNQMVSSSKDEHLIFWSITNKRKPNILQNLQPHLEAKKLIFCPNKPLLVPICGSSSDEIYQWNSSKIEIIKNLKQETSFIDINFNENGDIMVTLNQDRFLRIWKTNENFFEVNKKILIDENEILHKAYCLNDQDFIAHIGQSVYQLKIQDEKILEKSSLHTSDRSYCNLVSNNKIIAMKDSQDPTRIQMIVIKNQYSQCMSYYEKENQIKDFQFSSDTLLLAVATAKGAFIIDIKKNQTLHKFQLEQCCFLICFFGQEKLSILVDGELVLYEGFDSVAKKIPIIQSSPLKLVYLDQKQEICIYSQNSITLINLQELQQINLIQLDEDVRSRDLIFASNQVVIAVGQRVQFISLSNTITMVLLPQSYDSKKDHEYLYTNFQLDSNIFSVLNDDLLYYQFDISSTKRLKEIDLKEFGNSPLTLNNQQTLLIVSKEEIKQTILLIDMETKKTVTCLEEIYDNKFKCLNIVFSQDGYNFVTSYSDLRIKFWDTKSYKLLSTFKTNTNQIQILKISIKGILAQTSDDVIKLWDLNALKQQQLELDGHSSSVREICISSDGLQLVTGSEEEIIRWDLIELKKLDILIKGKRLPSKFCFSPNSQYFIAQAEESIHIWKFNTKYIIQFHKIYWCEPGLEQKLEVNYKQIQQQIQSDLKNQKREIILSTNLLIKTNPLEIFHINDRLELNNEQIVGISASQITTIAYCANSMRLAFEDENHQIIIWSIENKQRLGELNSNENQNTQLLSMIFSGNSKILFSYHNDKKIRQWNITDRFELIGSQHLENNKNLQYSLNLQLHPRNDEEFMVIWAEKVEDQTQCQNYKFFYQIGNDIDELFKPIVDFKDWDEKFSTAFNKSQNVIALQIKKTLKLYDISQIQIRVIATLEGSKLENLIFSSDGKILLSLGTDLTIRLYDISDYGSIKVKINLENPIQALAMQFLNSQTIRIFCKSDQIIQQSIQDFTEIGVIRDENQLDFTAAKQQLDLSKYSGKANNRTLEIFDSQTNQLQYTLNKFSSKINAISFVPSQEQFILGMDDGSILFYKIDQDTIKIYGIPICYYTFAKNPLLTAQNCSIRQSTFQTDEIENFQTLLCEQGAIKE
ncbi:unnamed protein product [Paramecium octaurelia]|uniref:Regulator of MON1-CCZ1 complex N-terminal domain-containing protein n=1 Tax=Paramecium octaurelia TaxID=43137 RepID=A0A8S1WRV3_PAROT|nr:unnamed protein product [Paramecium octaurelia]